MRIAFTFLLVVLVAGHLGAEEAPSSGPSFSDLVMKGFDEEKEKRYQEAVDLYTQALGLKDDSAAVLCRRAYSYAKLGLFEECAEDLKKALRAPLVTMLDYKAVAWLRATSQFTSVRDGTLAVAYAQEALAKEQSIELYDILAAGYAEMGNFQKAKDLVRKALKKYPDHPRSGELRQRFALYEERKPFRDYWMQDGDEKRLGRQIDESGVY